MVSLCGCTTTILPPAAPSEPATVYLIDYGQHSGLVFPYANGSGEAVEGRGEERTPSYVEFAFGEWRWFALNEEGFFGAIRALLFPTQGTLGRREIHTPPRQRREPGWHFDQIYPLTVEAADVRKLRAELEARWQVHEEERVYNETNGLTFVPDPQRYSLLRNCNPVLAGWLSQLGCEVRGMALLSQWRIESAPAGADD